MINRAFILQGDDTPPGSAPPVFTPPEVPTFMLAPQAVIITQPTPVVESNPIVGRYHFLPEKFNISNDIQ